MADFFGWNLWYLPFFIILLLFIVVAVVVYDNDGFQGFCKSFKDWEGNPVDVLVQQDASEFLTMFFQNMEGLTMGSKSENLLKDCFGGMLSNELIADGGKYSERGEPFSFISVPVQVIQSMTAMATVLVTKHSHDGAHAYVLAS